MEPAILIGWLAPMKEKNNNTGQRSKNPDRLFNIIDERKPKRKFRDFHRSGMAVRELSDTICVEHGKSIIENPKRTTKCHDRWEADNNKLPHQEIVQRLLNESGLKKLPTVRDLQDEYGELLAQKKAEYSEYIAVREEMRQLQRIRYAVGKLLYTEEEKVQNENEHDR